MRNEISGYYPHALLYDGQGHVVMQKLVDRDDNDKDARGFCDDG